VDIMVSQVYGLPPIEAYDSLAGALCHWIPKKIEVDASFSSIVSGTGGTLSLASLSLEGPPKVSDALGTLHQVIIVEGHYCCPPWRHPQI
jgi:hypothetical protein